jgi:hypothetical protein
MNPAPLYLRQEQFKFAMSNKGIPAHQGNVEGFALIDQGQHLRNQILSSEIRELTELCCTTQVSGVESVAAWAA